MTLNIIGLGYVGLPLALQAASKGLKVFGTDKNKSIVDQINNKESHIEDDFINNRIKDAGIIAKTDVVKSDAYIVCVPTPVNNEKEPDLIYVIKAIEEIADVVSDGELVVVESTIYPGVCEEIVKPILDKTGKNYLLAHCPERINPGDKIWNVSNIPRVVGGIDKKSTEQAYNLYSKIIDAEITKVSQIKAAEATKILENTFRDVNIAFINEMAQSFYRLGIDISEVIRGAKTKPFAFMAHHPGIGVGGHCIAVDPYYMIKQGKLNGFEHNFLIQARKINSNMPEFTMQIIQDELNSLGYPVKGTKVAVLGLSYKPGVADDRESPSYVLIKLLNEKQADITIYDPYLPDKSTETNIEDALKNCVYAVIATAHKEFLDPSLYVNIELLVDGRNCINKTDINKSTVYRGIGISG